MSKNHKGLLIGGMSLILVIIIALTLFFTLTNSKTEIYVNSYDNQIKFSLGSYKVKSFSVSSRNGNSIVKTDDPTEILENKVAGSPYLVTTYPKEYAGASYVNYVLLYEGYYFIAWVDNLGQLILENLIDEFAAATTEYLFTFPVTDILFDEDKDNFIEWKDLIWINSFNELADFYSSLSNDYCIIDEATQTIKLNCCDANNFRSITTEFPITITCMETGLNLLFDSEALDYD